MIIYVDFELGLGRRCANLLRELPSWKIHSDSIDDCEQIINENPTVTAWDDSKLIGFLTLCHQDEHTAELYSVAVSTDYQGQGVGRELLHQAEQDLSRLGQQTLRTHLNKASFKNLAERWTVHFFKRYGFREHPSANKLSMSNACYRLEKKLSSGARLAHSVQFN